MKTTLFLLTFMTAIASRAGDSNMRISGFKFQTCQSANCIEIASERAWMSQLGFSFTTDGATTVTLRHGTEVKTYPGTQATMHERLKLVVLDQADGTTKMFSMEDLNEVGGAQ